jgi:hypothetical protein
MELLDQQAFDLWRILNLFMKLYHDMPNNLVEKFKEIELRITCQLAWKAGSNVLTILDLMK